jgi:hypothetical protein
MIIPLTAATSGIRTRDTLHQLFWVEAPVQKACTPPLQQHWVLVGPLKDRTSTLLPSTCVLLCVAVAVNADNQLCKSQQQQAGANAGLRKITRPTEGGLLPKGQQTAPFCGRPALKAVYMLPQLLSSKLHCCGGSNALSMRHKAGETRPG